MAFVIPRPKAEESLLFAMVVPRPWVSSPYGLGMTGRFVKKGE
jgi:hypothetical protein